jgi:hypothetical protein
MIGTVSANQQVSLLDRRVVGQFEFRVQASACSFPAHEYEKQAEA